MEQIMLSQVDVLREQMVSIPEANDETAQPDTSRFFSRRVMRFGPGTMM